MDVTEFNLILCTSSSELLLLDLIKMVRLLRYRVQLKDGCHSFLPDFHWNTCNYSVFGG